MLDLSVSPFKSTGIRISGKSYLICSFLFALMVLVWFFGREVSQVKLGHRPLPARPSEALSRGAATSLSKSDSLGYRPVSHTGFFMLHLQRAIVISVALALIMQGLFIGFVKTFWADYEEFRANEVDWAGYCGD